MSVEEPVFVLDVGVKFSATVLDGTTPFDLTGYTVLFIFARGDGTPLTKAGSITDAANGKVECVSVANDMAPAGRWKLQLKLSGPANKVYHTTKKSFQVYENLPES